jgi:hypothetical protein
MSDLQNDEAGPVETLPVYEQGEDEDADEARIGVVDVYSDGRLAVVEADPGRESVLRDVVLRMNAKETLAVKSTEPQAGPGKVGVVSVSRDDPGFVGALRNYMASYYGLLLG